MQFKMQSCQQGTLMNSILDSGSQNETGGLFRIRSDQHVAMTEYQKVSVMLP